MVAITNTNRTRTTRVLDGMQQDKEQQRQEVRFAHCWTMMGVLLGLGRKPTTSVVLLEEGGAATGASKSRQPRAESDVDW